MKTQYQPVEMEVIPFWAEDVITTSVITVNQGDFLPIQPPPGASS